jgi:hypothetical protein
MARVWLRAWGSKCFKPAKRVRKDTTASEGEVYRRNQKRSSGFARATRSQVSRGFHGKSDSSLPIRSLAKKGNMNMLIYDWFMYFFVGSFPLVILFQIAMVIDCASNKSFGGSAKAVWIIFILAAHWVGATIYFLFRLTPVQSLIQHALGNLLSFVRRSYREYERSRRLERRAKRRRSQPKADSGPRIENYYQEGYRAQTGVRPVEEHDESAYPPPDEQPQTSYPSLPQQQDISY